MTSNTALSLNMSFICLIDESGDYDFDSVLEVSLNEAVAVDITPLLGCI